MPINGPIRPSYYVNYQAPAPNPSAVSSAKAGEMITCPHTGRIWINEGVSGQPAMMVQALPYVRSGTSPTAIATKTTNDTGIMKFEMESGAVGGGVNVMDQIVVTAGNVQMPNIAGCLLKTDNAGNLVPLTGAEDYDTVVWDAFTASWVVGQPQLTITRINKLTGDTTLVANTLTNIINVTATTTGSFLVNATTNIYHNNTYHIDYSLVSQQGTTGDLAYGPSGAMDANAGYTTISLSSIVTVYTLPRVIRFAVRASDAAVVKQFTNFQFPLGTIPSPQGARSDYATTISMTRIQ